MPGSQPRRLRSPSWPAAVQAARGLVPSSPERVLCGLRPARYSEDRMYSCGRLLPLVLCVLALRSGTASAQVPAPTIEGPVAGPGGPFVQTTAFDLSAVGYV